MKFRPQMVIGQVLFYAALAGIVGYFSAAPAYRHFPGDQAMIKMTLTHGGKYRGGCRRRTSEELQKIAPNMRREFDCPRDRVPVVVELDVDGSRFSGFASPLRSAWRRPASMYEGFRVATGQHTIDVRMRDTERTTGFDYENAGTFTFEPSQLLVIQFREESGGFTFTE